MKKRPLSKLALALGVTIVLLMPIKKSQAGIGLTAYFAIFEPNSVSGIGLYGITVAGITLGAISIAVVPKPFGLPLGIIFMALDEKTTSSPGMKQVVKNIVSQLPDIDDVSIEAREVIESAVINRLTKLNFKAEEVMYDANKKMHYVGTYLSMPELVLALKDGGETLTPDLEAALN